MNTDKSKLKKYFTIKATEYNGKMYMDIEPFSKLFDCDFGKVDKIPVVKGVMMVINNGYDLVCTDCKWSEFGLTRWYHFISSNKD